MISKVAICYKFTKILFVGIFIDPKIKSFTRAVPEGGTRRGLSVGGYLGVPGEGYQEGGG